MQEQSLTFKQSAHTKEWETASSKYTENFFKEHFSLNVCTWNEENMYTITTVTTKTFSFHQITVGKEKQEVK